MREISILSDKPKHEKRWSIPARIALLLGFWLFIGFAVGTVFLLFPVRWWANLCRQNGWPHTAETGGVVLIIVALVLVSFALANGAMTAFVRTSRLLPRALLVIVVLGAAGTAYWKWINPSTMKGSMAVEQTAGAHFTFGPFPDLAKLKELRKRGYTGVITLLHPAVVPFEPQLIAQEKKDAAAAGIELIHLPMLPWVSENTESLEKLRALAAAKQGQYYIHCYLGRDRVNVARRIIEQESGEVALVEGGDAVTRRTLDMKMEKGGFERGPIYKLEDGLYLTPYPTDGEFVSYILGGHAKNVVALLDPRDPESKLRIDFERDLLAKHELPFHLVELSEARYGGRRILEMLATVKSLEKPVLIHEFFTPGGGPAPIAEAVLIAYRTGLPPLPPSMWVKSMSTGQPEVVGPHIVIGPRPTAKEFGDALFARGVRSLLFVGESAAETSPDEAAAVKAALEWRTAPSDAARVLEIVQSGGPWYLYGPGAGSVKDAIRARYAAAMKPAEPVGGKSP